VAFRLQEHVRQLHSAWPFEPRQHVRVALRSAAKALRWRRPLHAATIIERARARDPEARPLRLAAALVLVAVGAARGPLRPGDLEAARALVDAALEAARRGAYWVEDAPADARFLEALLEESWPRPRRASLGSLCSPVLPGAHPPGSPPRGNLRAALCARLVGRAVAPREDPSQAYAFFDAALLWAPEDAAALASFRALAASRGEEHRVRQTEALAHLAHLAAQPRPAW
jgi:hypothetical protein